MNRPSKSAIVGGRVAPHPADPIKWAKHDPDGFAGGLIRPGYPSDAGYDLCASRTVTVPANGFAQIPTNVRVAIPEGKWGLLVGRSSTFHKRQLLVQTAVIDGGYRGELWAVVRNMADAPVTVQRKERVIQLILFDLITPAIVEVEVLPPGDRESNGFGSTGTGGEV